MAARVLIVTGLFAWVSLASSAGAAEPPAPLPIFEAISKGDVASVRRVLDADPKQAEARDRRGISAVSRALFATGGGEGFEPPQQNAALQAILAHEPTLDFFETCALGTREQVAAMLKAEPKHADSWHTFGLSPLHFAAFGGNEPVADLLIQRGAEVHARARNRFRNAPLAVALLTGQAGMARFLIERGADVNARQAGGAPPLHEAALLGRRDLVDLLLDHGAEIGARANDGRNAVSEAERAGKTDMVAYLRSRGGTDARITADLAKIQAEEK